MDSEELTEAELLAINKLTEDIKKITQQMTRVAESMAESSRIRNEKFDRIIERLQEMMPTPESSSKHGLMAREAQGLLPTPPNLKLLPIYKPPLLPTPTTMPIYKPPLLPTPTLWTAAASSNAQEFVATSGKSDCSEAVESEVKVDIDFKEDLLISNAASSSPIWTTSKIVNETGGEPEADDSSDYREHTTHTFTFDISNNGLNLDVVVNIGSSSSARGSRMMIYTVPSFDEGSRSRVSATSPKSSRLNLSLPDSAEQLKMMIWQLQQQQVVTVNLPKPPPRPPDGTFHVLKMYGAGKTKLAKALEEELCDDENLLVLIDVPGYMEQHFVAHSSGAPPGYVDQVTRFSTQFMSSNSNMSNCEQVVFGDFESHDVIYQVNDYLPRQLVNIFFEKMFKALKENGLWEKTHGRNVKPVLSLMIELEGLWVNLGQYMSTRVDMLPEANISLLRAKLERVCGLVRKFSYQQVERCMMLHCHLIFTIFAQKLIVRISGFDGYENCGMVFDVGEFFDVLLLCMNDVGWNARVASVDSRVADGDEENELFPECAIFNLKRLIGRVDTVPVLVDLVSYLLLPKHAKGSEKNYSLSLLDKFLLISKEVIGGLKTSGASWIQLDEPILVMDFDAHQLQAFTQAYAGLKSSLFGIHAIIITYLVDGPAEVFKAVNRLKDIRGIDFDLIRRGKSVDWIKGEVPAVKYLFIRRADGRNIWANDPVSSISTLCLECIVGKDKLVVYTTCSLHHADVDLIKGTELDREVKSWLAFDANGVRVVWVGQHGLRLTPVVSAVIRETVGHEYDGSKATCAFILTACHNPWEKLMLTARVIVEIENPKDIIVQSARPYGQRAVLKFAFYTRADAIAGRQTPGTFTNQLETSFSEPRLLILTDPGTDHQPIKKAALGSTPSVAFCDTDSPMRYVDIGIPANNKGKHIIGCLFWLLASMVLLMRGTIMPGHKWNFKVGLFFYKEPGELKKEEDDEIASMEYPVADFSAATGGWGAAPADLPWTEAAPIVLEQGNSVKMDMDCLDGFIAVLAYTLGLQEGLVTGKVVDVISTANTAAKVVLGLGKHGKNNKVMLSVSNPETRVENAMIAVIQFQITPSKTDIEPSMVVLDYTQVGRKLKEDMGELKHEFDEICKMIKDMLGCGGMCWKFFWFSSPRPPDIHVNLEDKVNFKGRGMLRKGILWNFRGALIIS